MKPKQLILLFIALLLPACIFIFLRVFGKNEFNVPPLFQTELPEVSKECKADYTLPYLIPDSIFQSLNIRFDDSLTCVSFSPTVSEQLQRAIDANKNRIAFPLIDPVKHAAERKCIFLLTEPFDVALVDRKGRIRGHYISSDRDEVDRLITEIAIILKQY